jgi:hypothetical protein
VTRRIFLSLRLAEKRGLIFAGLGAALAAAGLRAQTPAPVDSLPAAYTASGLNFADAEVPHWNGGVFTIQHMPNPPQCLKLYRNGIRLTQSVDYTLSTPTGVMGLITLAAGIAYDAADLYICDYRY